MYIINSNVQTPHEIISCITHILCRSDATNFDWDMGVYGLRDEISPI